MADLSFRDDTWDRNIWKSVVDRDEYRLGATCFDPRDVILDIGAHIGSFAYTCLDRGAGRVIAVEPDSENMVILQHNLHVACGATDRAVLISAAAWRSDQPAGVVSYSRVAVNTGGGNTLGESGQPVASLPFDDLIQLAAAFSLDRVVRLVKLDCEGAEWPILLTSNALQHVDAIIGEYHTIEDLQEFSSARVDNRHRCDRSLLETILHRAGFDSRFGSEQDGLGIFAAWRPGKEFAS